MILPEVVFIVEEVDKYDRTYFKGAFLEKDEAEKKIEEIISNDFECTCVYLLADHL